MLRHYICKSLHEQRVIVWGHAPSDLLGTDFLADVAGVLYVQLVERFDVLVDKRDRYEKQIFLTSLDKYCKVKGVYLYYIGTLLC